MTWVENIGYAAIGSILTVIVDALWRLFVEGRRHTLELRRRYFDLKFKATLDFIDQWKSALLHVKVVLKILDLSLHLPGGLNNPVLERMSLEIRNTIERTSRQAISSSATTIEFFYGKEVFRILKEIEKISEILLPFFAELVMEFDKLKWVQSKKIAGETHPDYDEFERLSFSKAKELTLITFQLLEEINHKIDANIELFKKDFRWYQTPLHNS